MIAGFVRGDLGQIKRNLEDPFAASNRKFQIPGYDEAKREAIELGAIGFCLSGSGPSCFAISDTMTKAQLVGQRCSEILGANFKVCTIAKQGARIIS